MPKKFTDLAELTAPDLTDLLALVDVSANVSKKITLATLLAFFVPSGTIHKYAGSTAPTGFLLCDGSPVSRTTYAALFTAIGTAYGTGDGSTTFNVPNFVGRTAVGYDSTQTEFNALGKTGGAKTHTLVTAELPAHSHSISDPGHTHGINSGVGFGAGGLGTSKGRVDVNNPATLWSFSASTNGTGITGTNNTGSDTAHNNLQPFITVNFIIKV